jgi:Activator of Hsp90 ATPase homolog 1-like protein
MTKTLTVAPVVKSVHVACSPRRAFEAFTQEIGAWWPLETHARHPGAVREIVWEQHEGGAVYEVSTDGEKAHWATVLAWDPYEGFTIAWHVNADAPAPTEVEVRFRPESGGTRVLLEHRHWDRLGPAGAETRGRYDGGWDGVLAPYVAHAG